MLDDFFGARTRTVEFCRRLAGQTIAMPSVRDTERWASELSIVESIKDNPSVGNCNRLSNLHAIPCSDIADLFNRHAKETIAARRKADRPAELCTDPLTLGAVARLVRRSEANVERMVKLGIIPQPIEWRGVRLWPSEGIEAARDAIAKYNPERKRGRRRTWPSNRPVVCFESGESFPTIEAAAAAVGQAPLPLWLATQGGTECGRFHFVDPSVDEAKRPALRAHKAIWVQRTDTGEVFQSCRQAAMLFGDGKTTPSAQSKTVTDAARDGTEAFGIRFRLIEMAERPKVYHLLSSRPV